MRGGHGVEKGRGVGRGDGLAGVGRRGQLAQQHRTARVVERVMQRLQGVQHCLQVVQSLFEHLPFNKFIISLVLASAGVPRTVGISILKMSRLASQDWWKHIKLAIAGFYRVHVLVKGLVRGGRRFFVFQRCWQILLYFGVQLFI